MRLAYNIEYYFGIVRDRKEIGEVGKEPEREAKFTDAGS